MRQARISDQFVIFPVNSILAKLIKPKFKKPHSTCQILIPVGDAAFSGVLNIGPRLSSHAYISAQSCVEDNTSQ